MTQRNAKLGLTLGTALGLSLASSLPALAQDQQNRLLSDQELAQLSSECQDLAAAVRDADGDLSRSDREIINILENDRAQECVAVSEELGLVTTAAAKDKDRETETAQDSETVKETTEVEQQATIEGEAVVKVPEPDVDVAIAAPQVQVRPGQPDVKVNQQPSTIQVRQPQPNIDVEVPQINVRVDIPAPEIFVRSSDPQIDVAAGEPQVEVRQDEPKVSVRQADPELEMDLGVDEDGKQPEQTAEAETEEAEGRKTVEGNVEVTEYNAKVEMLEPQGEPRTSFTGGEPQIEYQSAEPKINVTMPQQPNVEVAQVGQPKVTFETPEERDARHAQEAKAAEQQAAASNAQADTQTDAQQTAEAAPQDDAAEAGEMIVIGDLMDMEVRGENGDEIGEPEAFVEQNGEVMMVLEVGGFLGLGEKEVALPLSDVAFAGDYLEVPSMTEEDVENAQEFDYDENAEMDEDAKIRIQ